jgi:DNA-binding NtrC family response regulator
MLETLNLADAESALIARALEVTGGHRIRAAKLLGMSVRTLRHKLNTPTQSGDAGTDDADADDEAEARDG